jgi:acyl carrier protein
MTPEGIDSEAPLFGEGLGLDSIDALELAVLLDKNYGIKIQASKEGPKIFRSVKTIAEYILEHQKK